MSLDDFVFDYVSWPDCGLYLARSVVTWQTLQVFEPERYDLSECRFLYCGVWYDVYQKKDLEVLCSD